MTDTFIEHFNALCLAKRFEQIIDAVPYAKLIGMRVQEDEEGDLLFLLPFDEKNIGNTALPALHGGVIGGFLENAALLHLMYQRHAPAIPKIINFSLDYLRSGRSKELFAQCEITKQGKRVVHVLIEAWQESRCKPVAVARAHFLLPTSVG